jgi:hypothetical protein
MEAIAFITDYEVVDRIINNLKLTFVADRPLPPHEFEQPTLLAAKAGAGYFL